MRRKFAFFLRDNQDPEKEAGKAVRELKLHGMVCNICDKHYGRFNRISFKVTKMLRTFEPRVLDDSDAGSDSSNLSSTVASVAIIAGGLTRTRKRKRPTAEEGKKDDE